jgi:hypothetical protein
MTTVDSAGFEGGSTDIGPFQDWYNETLSSSTDYHYSGSRSLKIATSYANWGFDTPWPGTYSVTADQQLTVSGQLLCPDATDTSLSVYVSWYDSGESWITSNGKSLTDTIEGWTSFSHQVTAPSGAVTAQVAFYGNNGHTHYLDDYLVTTP